MKKQILLQPIPLLRILLGLVLMTFPLYGMEERVQPHVVQTQEHIDWKQMEWVLDSLESLADPIYKKNGEASAVYSKWNVVSFVKIRTATTLQDIVKIVSDVDELISRVGEKSLKEYEYNVDEDKSNIFEIVKICCAATILAIGDTIMKSPENDEEKASLRKGDFKLLKSHYKAGNDYQSAQKIVEFIERCRDLLKIHRQWYSIAFDYNGFFYGAATDAYEIRRELNKFIRG